MANYHCTFRPISRRNGKSPVGRLAYRSGTDLKDQRNGETYYYSSRVDVFHVDMVLPEGAPQWVVDLAQELQADRQRALQKFSDIIEAAEHRKDSRVYREVEFSLPNELTKEENIEWADEFVRDIFCSKGMVAIVNYHSEFDEELGIEKPHCHVLLSTRNLTEKGFSRFKNLDWNSKDLVDEGREQCAEYQNAALEKYGFDVRVTHLSYEDRGIDVDGQTKLGKNVRQMTGRGIQTDKQKIFDRVRLKNQFKIVKNPEIVFSIVTSQHSTFTRKDIAKVLHRYIDDAQQFNQLFDRLMNSKELVNLEASGRHKDTGEPVYTTQEMLRIEMNLVRQAETLSAQKTHPVSAEIVEKVIAKHHEKFKEFGGLSSDQEAAIRHMLASDQISCVVGFAGAGKTTCLEAVKEAWEESGYKILGLAPTGKAARNIESCGIRAITIHKFLLAQKSGREPISHKTIIVGDEFGMVDSRRCSELLSLIHKTGAKIVPMGDNNQAQAVEAGPAFRLLTTRVKPAVLEKIVRQQIDWQQEASRLFGISQARDALKAYQDHGCFTTVSERLPNFHNRNALLDSFCLARQVSGRIWKEMREDYKQSNPGTPGQEISHDLETDFSVLATHQDFDLFKHWKDTRQEIVARIIQHYDHLQGKLKERGVNLKALDPLVAVYKATSAPDPAIFTQIEAILRKMSYKHIYDTRKSAHQEMVKAWAKDYEASPQQSHLMLAFTNKDANKLNEAARTLMRDQGIIKGKNFEYVTQRIVTDEFNVERITYHERTFAKGDRILFTRNNNSLNVKNGSLGTILSLDYSRITVQLDKVGDAEAETVSFSPNLYPFIDNGWATTIIKAQGVTVDHVKLLASFEQYRNLAYVGMSRHRLSLKIYASSLDFWRKEKIIDRLSRVQEKLSGFDYLDTDKIQEKLKEDTDILWHQQKIQQGKDFWKAIKVTAWDVFDKFFERSQGIKEGDDYQAFEDSEEIRSKDFFEDDSKDQRKVNFNKEERLSSKGPKSGRADNYQPKTSAQAQGFKKDDGLSPDGSKSEQEDNHQPKPQNSSNAQAQKQEQQNKNPKIVPQSSDTDKKIKAAPDKIKQDDGQKITFKEKRLSFDEADQQLKGQIHELATDILGKPTSRTSTQLRFGKKGSVCVFINGPKKGLYANHERGVYGGTLKLIEDQMGLSSSKEALKWAKDWLGGHSVIVERQIMEKGKESNKSTWTPITPVPKSAGNPDIAKNKYLNFMLKDGYQETARYAYRDAEGYLKGYVVRLEKEEADGTKHKKTPPLAYCTNERGFKAWKWQAFDAENKTPYGVEKLTQGPKKPVLIVSGEKTADVASQLLPEYHVLTWLGGDGNVGKTNWACLIGKEVTIWPDHDESCLKAADTLKDIIAQLNQDHGKESRVSIVNLPEELPTKWDLADQLPEGWSLDTVRQMVRGAAAMRESASSKDQGADYSQSLIPSDLDAYIPLENSLPYLTNTCPDPFAEEKAAFEQERLPFHQEWCANLGFFCQHKRYPGDEAEISAAYWQGERLTAIEGRLYGEALAKGKRKIDEDKLTLQARAELAKNQSAPDHIMVFGKASDLTEAQLKQFEQHVLMYRDKTSQLPNSSELNTTCQAIKVHEQFMNTESLYNKPEGETKTHLQPDGVLETIPQKNLPLNASGLYRTLIEQQALLTYQVHKEKENDKEDNALMKEGLSPQQLRFHQMQELCSKRLQRLNEKTQESKGYAQEMKILEMNRQNSRGMDI